MFLPKKEHDKYQSNNLRNKIKDSLIKIDVLDVSILITTAELKELKRKRKAVLYKLNKQKKENIKLNKRG